jgi:release factor glutamine methyltransferase
VFAEDEARLLRSVTTDPGELATLVSRRAAGLPLEHVLGWAEFAGLRVELDPGVFVPRRRTEFLITTAAELAPQHAKPASRCAQPASPEILPASRGAVVVDLCCGSGALGLALASRLGGAEVTAADIDPAAVACARRNLALVGGRAYQGDLFDALPAGLRGRVELLLANVPYVPTGEVDLLPPEARLHEPLTSLDGGTDGLAVLRRVAAGAPAWLAPGGHLLTETSDSQAPVATAIMAAAGLSARVARSAEDDATVLIGTRPAG